MNAARRSRRRSGWPRGLYEPRPGYYVWRHPNGKTHALGAVSFALARAEAIEANAYVAQQTTSLVARISGEAHTVADLLKEMPAAKAANTAKSWRSLDKRIAEGLGSVDCGKLDTPKCAQFLEAIEATGKHRLAEATRSRLSAICQRGQQLGWLRDNPVTPTRRPEVQIKRGRLTLEMFWAIYEKAPQVSEWLQHAMMLGLVTGADRVTISHMTRADVADGWLTYTRSKTKARIAVPLSIRLEVVGVTLADLVARKTGVVSKYLVHHVNVWGNAPAGSRVFQDRISHAFTEARKLAGILDEGAPTFHELRSLAARLYTQQGNVDVQQLLGHANKEMTDVYRNPRGVEAVLVRVNERK